MKSFKEYLSRVGKARGFGIQSPWAYRFVTEIVGERCPYYYYETIEQMYKNRKERKFQKFIYRLRNFVYPQSLLVINIADADDELLRNTIIQCTEKGVFVLRGIYNDEFSRRRWLDIQNRSDIGITFDMYDFAVCFLDTNIYKQHYKINF